MRLTKANIERLALPAGVNDRIVFDAALRLNIPFRVAPSGIAPVIQGARAAGRVLPAKHFGSVDVFLEAMENAEAGDVLVIDNAGRCDEGCMAT